MTTLGARIRELSLQLEMKTNDLKLQHKMQSVTEGQMNQLRSHIEMLSSKAAKST